MADKPIKVDFTLKGALARAAGGMPVGKAAPDDIRFYFSKKMAEPSILNWCGELGKALGAEVRFAAAGAPDRAIEGAQFQVNVKLPQKPGADIDDITKNPAFQALVKKNLTFASQQLMAMATEHAAREFRDGDPESLKSSSVTFVKSKEPPAFSADMRTASLVQLGMKANFLRQTLGGEQNNRELCQLLDGISATVKTIVERAGQNEHVVVTPEERQHLHDMSSRLKMVYVMLLQLPQFLATASHCLDGWDPSTKPDRAPQFPQPGQSGAPKP